MDEDIDLVEVQPYLDTLGFTTKSALSVQPPLVGDVAILRYTRRYNWILVCHDKHVPERKRKVKSQGGKPTPEGWFTELANKGGRVIEIQGGQQQPALEAVGKLIKHRAEWLEFFSTTHGAVLVHAQGMTAKPPDKLLRELGTRLTLKEQIPEKAPALKSQPKSRAKRPRKLLGAELTSPFDGFHGTAQ